MTARAGRPTAPFALRVRSAAVVIAGVAAATTYSSVAHAQFLDRELSSRPPLPAGEFVIDAVLAVVEIENDDRPPIYILQSDVVLAARLELAMRAGSSGLRARLDGAAIRGALEQMIGELLLSRDAARARDAPPTAAMVSDERARIGARLATVGGLDGFLAAVGATQLDLDELARRRVVVSGYLEGHLARTIEPSESDVRAAYDNERVQPFRAEGVPFSEARPLIRVALIREGFARAIRSYLQSISSRARVQLFQPENIAAF